MKRKYFALLLLITLITIIISDVSNVFAYSALEESEPNNSFQKANYLRANSWMKGRITDWDSSDDYYKVDLNDYGKTTVFSLEEIPFGCDFDIYVYDSNYRLIGSDTSSSRVLNSVSFSSHNSLSPGTYYIKIKRYLGYSESQYRVSFDVR